MFGGGTPTNRDIAYTRSSLCSSPCTLEQFVFGNDAYSRGLEGFLKGALDTTILSGEGKVLQAASKR